MKTNNITVTIVSVIAAIIIAASSAFFVSSVKANAAERKPVKCSKQYELPASTTGLNSFAKSYVFKASSKTVKNAGWKIKGSVNNIKVKGSYNAKARKYTFKAVGKSYGLNYMTIKYKVSDTKWATAKMTLFVDSQNYIMRTA